MRKLLILSLILLTAVSAFGQKNPPRPKAPASVKMDLGKLVQNTYTNEFFGFKIEFPEGWLVGDNELESSLYGLIKPQIKAKNSKNQTVFDRSMEQVTPLLGGYRYLPGSRVDNSSLRISVENLRLVPHVKSGKDYMDVTIRTLKLMKTAPGFMYSEPKTEMINSQKLDYIDMTNGPSNGRVYAVVRKGYAIVFNIQSFSPEDFEILQQVFKSADLNYKKK